MKLFKVELRGMTYSFSGPVYGEAYVVAEDPTTAYEIVRKSLKEKKIGYSTERELSTITLIAEEGEYPDCGTILYIQDGSKEDDIDLRPHSCLDELGDGSDHYLPKLPKGGSGQSGLHKKETTIKEALETIRKAFKEGGYEPGGFYHGYLANVAVILMDELNLQDKNHRDSIAERILKRIFWG